MNQFCTNDVSNNQISTNEVVTNEVVTNQISTKEIFQIIKDRPAREAFLMLHGIILFQHKNFKGNTLQSIIWILDNCLNFHDQTTFSKIELENLLKLTDACLPDSDVLDFLTMFQPGYFMSQNKFDNKVFVEINQARQFISMLPPVKFNNFCPNLVDAQINIRLVKKDADVSNYLNLNKVINYSPFEEITAFVSIIKPTSIILKKSKYDLIPMIILFYTANHDNPFDYHALPSIKNSGVTYNYHKDSDQYKIVRISIPKKGQLIYDARIEQEKKLLPGGIFFQEAKNRFNKMNKNL